MAVVNAASAASGHKPKRVVISTAKNAKFGTILVSGGVHYKTVYTLEPTRTHCGAQCLKIWPEVLLPTGVTSATAGPGVNAADLGTVTRAGGALQVTYAGKPLYWFSGDKRARQVRGNVTDKWGKWSVYVTGSPATVQPTASPVTTTPTTSPTPTPTAPAPRATTPTPMTTPATSPPPPPPPPTTTTTAPGGGGAAF